MSEVYESPSVARPDFRERVMALAGHSTFREPMRVGGSADARRSIPSDHLVAAALSFGRQGGDDIGPDIAFDMATGRRGHARRVCTALGVALAGDRSRLVRRCRPWLAIAAASGYGLLVDGQQYPRPKDCSDDDWLDLVAASAAILEQLAEGALSLAAQRAQRAA